MSGMSHQGAVARPDPRRGVEHLARPRARISLLHRCLPYATAALCGVAFLPAAIAQTPAARTQENRIESVAGTTWAGEDSDGDHYVFTFNAGGSLHYVSPSGKWTDANWTQQGDAIYFSMNNKYSEYRGRLTGDRMEGSASNVNGKRWTWSVTKRQLRTQKTVTPRPAI